MTSEEIRQKFLEFFSKRGHKIIHSSSLIPRNDPSVLLTTAGMQQFKRYFTGELNPEHDFGSHRIASIQKSFRVSDIEEVGDETHLTFFQMLGNFSFGPVVSDDPNDFGKEGYFKRASIRWAYEFMTEILEIKPESISVSVFAGDKETPEDTESWRIWTEEIKIPENKVRKMGRLDNFWGPTGSEGPCGPTSEIYADGVEIWNIVFNEYYRDAKGKFSRLEKPGVDTGMGLERLSAVLLGTADVFETDLFRDLILKLRELTQIKETKTIRILADHLRAASFLIAEGLRPSNKEAGYILRRLIRRTMAYEIKYDVHSDIFKEPAEIISRKYREIYPELKNTDEINSVLNEEKTGFVKAVSKGIKELEKSALIDGSRAFYLYETFGLPFEIIKELGGKSAASLKKEDFDKEFERHQETSKAGAVKKFGGHGLLLDTGEIKAGTETEVKKVTRLHTATHILHQALRQVLGKEVRQMGSDITPERIRFDFSCDRKLSEGEIQKIEKIVNDKIKENLEVRSEEMTRVEAEKTGALHFFNGKYPDIVKIYSIGDWSREFCNGPHVSSTAEVGEIKIMKEESVAAGVRRIRAVVLP